MAAGAALSGGACSQPRAEGPKSAGDAPAQAGLLAVGAPAPDVAGKDGTGRMVHLQERQGHVSIVYFYPKDGTPGCTKEACAFRDAFDKFAQRDVTIFGVSRDDEASHAKFRAEHQLQFPLVADPDGKVQLAYGVPDRMPGLASRVTFLVAADGRIAKVWPDVDPAVHADEVWAAIDQLK
jgi:peroxiredoxin Q/BCP